MTCATGGIEHYDTLWGTVLNYCNHKCNVQVWSDGRCPWEALHNKPYINDEHDNVYGAGGTYHVPKEHRESKLTNPGARCVWVGRSKATPDSDIIVPIVWDADMNAYNLGAPQVATRVEVDNTTYPLREGPVAKKKEGEVDGKAFMDKYNLPNYKLKKGSDWSEYQTDPGHDPIWEVEAIEGKSTGAEKPNTCSNGRGYPE